MRNLRSAFCVIASFVAIGTSRAAVLSFPDDAAGAPGANVIVPLTATPPNGILGMDLTVTYTSSVIQITDVTTTPLSQGFTVTFNASNPNVLYISLFGTTAMGGGPGPILDVHVHVVGAIGQTSALNFSDGSINEGAISISFDPGAFQVCNVPVEVLSLSVTGATSTTLSWTGQGSGFRYDVASASLASLTTAPGTGPAQCLLNDQATTSGVDSRPRPAAGTGYYYIVRAQNACGTGPYGFSSSGLPEVPTAACP